MVLVRGYTAFLSLALLVCALGLSAVAESVSAPLVEFTLVPPSSSGNGVRIDRIAGRVRRAGPGQKIVLFAKSGVTWYVQPAVSRPFTEIQPDSRWNGVTHPGTVYAALLVDAHYVPPSKIDALPEKGGSVLAVATAVGPPPAPPVEIQFSGYPWRVRDGGRQQSGQNNFYDPANATVDKAGLLHLRVSKRDGDWLCSEVSLTRSLGYGTYRFVVRDISRFEPAAVLIVGPSSKMAIELGRWGRREDGNAQYVIVPYTIPANTFRFVAPPGTLTHWLDWKADRATFRTVRGSSAGSGGARVAEHAFTSGVDAPGNERISLNLYALGNARDPLTHPFEVVVEKFEFFP